MKESKVMSALQSLQDNLANSAKEYRERNSYSQNPPVYTYDAGDKIDYETQARVMKQRSLSIMAEMRKVAREEILDTETFKKELDSSLNAFLRSFKLEETEGIPEKYSLSQGNGVNFTLTVQNTGYRYRWGTDNAEPIVLRVSAKVSGVAGAPDIAKYDITLYDAAPKNEGDDNKDYNSDHNKSHTFNLTLPHEGFFERLDPNKYIFEFNLYEGDSKFVVRSNNDTVNDIVSCNVGE